MREYWNLKVGSSSLHQLCSRILLQVDYINTLLIVKIFFSLIEKVSKMCTPCQTMDARELSWPVESRTISLTTFAKDRWQIKNISKSTTAGKLHQFETIRYRYNFFSVEDIFLIYISLL